jgi:hypothetical protein
LQCCSKVVSGRFSSILVRKAMISFLKIIELSSYLLSRTRWGETNPFFFKKKTHLILELIAINSLPVIIF